MQHDWFMYHLRSTYKNRLDFPFKCQNNDTSAIDIFVSQHSRFWSAREEQMTIKTQLL